MILSVGLLIEKPLRCALTAALAIASPAPLGCSSEVPSETARVEMLARVGDEWSAARQRWVEAGVPYYTFVIARSCECLPEIGRPTRVIVRRRAGARVEVIESITDAQTGEPASEERKLYVLSVDGLFSLIEKAIDDGAADVRVVYDEAKGYPSSLYIDPNGTTVDDELILRVSGFQEAGSDNPAARRGGAVARRLLRVSGVAEQTSAIDAARRSD